MGLPQPDLFATKFQPSHSISDELATFTYEGKRTEQQSGGDTTYFFNEFWTARQRQGHSIHEISYRACFKSQLPGFFISRLTKPGETVYDPFMGRGTTLVEASLLGRQSIGNDINPLSVYLTRPRMSAPTVDAVRERLASLNWTHAVADEDDLLVFFHRETLAEIYALRRYLLERQQSQRIDAIDDWIRMVALNRLTGHSSGFFSVYSLPPNQAVSVNAQRKINEKRNQIPPRRNVDAIIIKKTRTLLADELPPARHPAQFHTGSADHTPGIATGSVDLVVTSPPFLDVVQYASDNWMRTWFAGIDVDSVEIAMHRDPDDWTSFIRNVFIELERVVRPKGYVAFEVGEVRNGKVALDELVLKAVEGLQFKAIGVVVNVQEFTKTANCWGISNNSKGTNTNRIVLLERQ